MGTLQIMQEHDTKKGAYPSGNEIPLHRGTLRIEVAQWQLTFRGKLSDARELRSLCRCGGIYKELSESTDSA